jgi:hypothetical protein
MFDNVRYWILNVLTSRSNQSIGGFDVRAAQANARARLIDEHIYAEARMITLVWSVGVSRTEPPSQTEITLAINYSARAGLSRPMVVSGGMLSSPIIIVVIAIPWGCAAHTGMKMVESHPERWSQGRCFLSAMSLCVSLTWMPNGTLGCDHHPAGGKHAR